MFGVEVAQTKHEMPQVNAVEGAVNEWCDAIEFGVGGVHHEVVRCLVHQQHQLLGVVDDGDTLAPSDGGSEETDHFRILAPCE